MEKQACIAMLLLSELSSTNKHLPTACCGWGLGCTYTVGSNLRVRGGSCVRFLFLWQDMSQRQVLSKRQDWKGWVGPFSFTSRTESPTSQQCVVTASGTLCPCQILYRKLYLNKSGLKERLFKGVGRWWHGWESGSWWIGQAWCH